MPTAPVLAVSSVTCTEVSLSWDTAGGTQYQVEKCAGAGCSAFAFEVTRTPTNAVVNLLTPGGTYRFRVRVSVPSIGPWSNEVEATTATTPLRQLTGWPPIDTVPDNAPAKTFGADVLPGSLLTMTFMGWGDRTVIGVADTQGNTWVKAFRSFIADVAPMTQHLWAELWYCESAAGGACTVTATITTASFAGFGEYVIAEWPGDFTFDVSGTLQTPGSVMTHDTAASGSQTGAGLLLALCSLGTSAGGDEAWIPAGFASFASNSVFRQAYKQTASAETLVRTFSGDPFVTYSAAGIASFLGAPSGGGGGSSVTDNSDICCSTGNNGTTVPAGGGQGNGATPVMYPAIGSQIECAGGGLVPTQADIVHAESWWGA